MPVATAARTYATLHRRWMFAWMLHPSDQPDSANLTSSDVILHALVDFPGGPAATVQSVAVDAMVAPGWYAVVFGTGAFGATAISASVPSSGPGGCTLPGSSFPFSIRQSDGMFILQGATPHMFVRVVP